MAEKLEKTDKYSLIAREIRDASDDIMDYEFLLHKHPTIDAIKVEFPLISYHDETTTIDFISGKGNLLEVRENGEWHNAKRSLEQLWKEMAQ